MTSKRKMSVVTSEVFNFSGLTDEELQAAYDELDKACVRNSGTHYAWGALNNARREVAKALFERDLL